MKELLKNVWSYVVLAIGLLAGLLFWEKSKRKDAESELENADVMRDLAVLNAEKEAALAIAEVEKGRKLTPQEMEDFLGKL
jgi:hypothetical protein